MPFLGFEFQPTYDSGDFSISVKGPTGTNLEKMKELMIPIEDELSHPEVDIVGMRLGGTRTGNNQGTTDVKLVPAGERDKTMMQIMDELRAKFRNIKDLNVSVVSGQGGGRGDKRPVQVGLRGSDIDILKVMHKSWRRKSELSPVLLMWIFPVQILSRKLYYVLTPKEPVI